MTPARPKTGRRDRRAWARRLAGSAAIVVVLLGGAGPAAAVRHDASGGAELDEGEVSAGITESAPAPAGGGVGPGRPGHGNRPPGGGTGAGSPSESPYVRVYSEERRAPAFRGCPDGLVTVVIGVLPDGTERVLSTSCASAGGAAAPTAGAPAALDVAPLPPPPTAAEVRDAVPIPVMAPQVDPRVEGLVGLPTHLWYAGPAQVDVSVTLGPYRVDASAAATHFRWDLGDGTVVHTDSPGGPEAPAVRHPYRQRGPHRITVSVQWTGTYTFSGPAGTATAGLGSVERAVGLDYVVRDAQAVRR